MSNSTSDRASVGVTSRLRSAQFFLPSTLLAAVAAIVMSSAIAQEIATYGYSRATLSGIPPIQGESGVLFTKYYLYVEVKPGSRVSAEWAWVRGNYYDCRIEKVRTPVLVESDPGVPTDRKETLVPKTSNDVYRVIVGEKKTRTPSNDQEKELVAKHEAVIALVVNKSSAYVSVPSINALRPAAAM